MSAEPNLGPRPGYDVFLCVCGASNPGPHAVGMVVVSGSKRYEWAQPIGQTSTPLAWRRAVLAALARVDRPGSTVTLVVHDEQLAKMLVRGVDERAEPSAREIAALLEQRPLAAVTFVPKRDRHPEMERAHALAAGCLSRGVP